MPSPQLIVADRSLGLEYVPASSVSVANGPLKALPSVADRPTLVTCKAASATAAVPVLAAVLVPRSLALTVSV